MTTYSHSRIGTYELNKVNLPKFPEKSGVYIINLYKINRPLKIGRLLGIDKNGILMIGESKHLRKRLNQFLLAKQNGKTKHSEGRRFHRYNLTEKLPSGWKLKVGCRPCKNHKKEERRLLTEYRETFGELPPLNYKDSSYVNKKKL